MIWLTSDAFADLPVRHPSHYVCNSAALWFWSFHGA